MSWKKQLFIEKDHTGSIQGPTDTIIQNFISFGYFRIYSSSALLFLRVIYHISFSLISHGLEILSKFLLQSKNALNTSTFVKQYMIFFFLQNINMINCACFLLSMNHINLCVSFTHRKNNQTLQKYTISFLFPILMLLEDNRKCLTLNLHQRSTTVCFS